MITGAHTVLYSPDADALREFFRDVLGFPSVDAGGGWLIFGLPPSELAVHPGEAPGSELYLMCDDLEATMAELRAKGVELGPVSDQGWGRVTTIALPGGGELGLYEPRHPRP
jgi:catechol 2,3-dioxygenase-like lactoylglutathione lyase family enzyme